ncbi:MAG: hypothetical protein J7M30_13140 [Deltaproteobacteria bacterium]|nr:hypothetical protein [Deltaproteobacteria bacterium]
MNDQTGKNESRILAGGEIVHLVKEPDAEWRIRFYECRHNVRLAGATGDLVFEYLEGLPQDWKDREFETPDEAAKFAQQEIRDSKVPANGQSAQ